MGRGLPAGRGGMTMIARDGGKSDWALTERFNRVGSSTNIILKFVSALVKVRVPPMQFKNRRY